ncbi:MAG: alanine--tRNA ligase [Candidatus Heimdallarchaeota archaeon]|nr:alanine--tRNA ligase [Candidatus Heimdallarchaeota archaeon]MCK4955362.1 alanine--tRNA ligase [Candidatus Heimdallarchaeota archaeon]
MSIPKNQLKERFKKEDYEVSLFKEEGFTRKKCPTCNHYFWTLVPDQEICGDTRCAGGYKFLDKPGKNLNFDQTIKSLTDFFVKHGHTAIKDYPVVSRWRGDMDFTIASIADFQPWVLEGIIDPPANPLVVPQMVIRTGGEFSDIDNIGKTSRHLTSFVMFGQHSFNSATLTDGYWMDRCLELNFKYLKEELGLKSDEISYVEGIWSGGGNFGPNLEAMAYGIEVVNNVFIAYGFENGNVKKLDMQVIDVGWGLERTSWFSQGTPTIYEAIFPKAIEYLQKENGYKPNHDLLIEYSKLSGLLAVEEVKDLGQERIELARKLGMTFDEMIEKIGPQEAIYAIADHTRTLSMTIADGAIPSNVGGGYNLRALLRRIIALKELFNLQFSINDIFDLQIDHLSVSYPRVKEHRDDIHKIIDIEVKRYEETKNSGRRLVNQLISKKNEFNLKTLIDLYQNNGINPLMIKEIAKEKDIEVAVPEDFYIKMEKHLAKQSLKEKKIKAEMKFELKEEYKTYEQYYDDVYQTEFEAEVIGVVNDYFLILDKTIFYPTGGGQIHDIGIITSDENKYRVEDVLKKGSAILHKLKEKCFLKPGDKVKGKIDGKRRLAIMRHHTAVHVVNNAAREVLGQHVWQAGTDKTKEKARLDITHYTSISFEELQKIEMLANQIVLENRSVTKSNLDRDEAEKNYGFQIYQGGVVPGKILHIVSVTDWDIEACGGTHLDNTGDIGIIIIASSERIQDGVVRLEILAGIPALKYIQEQDSLLNESSKILSVEPKILPKTALRFFKEWKEQKKTIESLNKQIAELQFSSSKIDIIKIQGVDSIIRETTGNQKELLVQATEAVKTLEQGLCVLISVFGNKVIIVGAKSSSLNIDLSGIIKDMSAVVGGSGGGKGDIAIGGGSLIDKIPEIFKDANKIIEQRIERN